MKDIFKKIINYDENYSNTHRLVVLFGIKIKMVKINLSKQFKKYKNSDLTTIPKATGEFRNIQSHIMKILQSFDKICRENDLQYWLDFGTLIGAVRHSGFIPWDDDIDLGMLRKDYDRIIEIINNTPDSTIYAKKSYIENGSNNIIKIFYNGYPNLFIDIFPYDNVSSKNNNKIKLFLFEKKFKSIRREITKNSKKNVSKLVLQKEIVKAEDMLFPNGFDDIIGENLVWGLDFHHIRHRRWIYPTNYFLPLKEMEFEGKLFFVPNNSDKYLKNVYGDYMKFPKRMHFHHKDLSIYTEEELAIIKK
ncbi:MAG: LicD family protein [Candidatus Gastranaerophilales bacterium]